MVHKKSEYRLSYKWLPAEIKNEIVKISASNVDYRVQRRLRDHSHHPWEWHCIDDDKCDCDDNDEADRFLPPPPVRQKHNLLINEWNRGKGHENNALNPEELEHFKEMRDVRTPILRNNATKPSSAQFKNKTFHGTGDAYSTPVRIDTPKAIVNNEGDSNCRQPNLLKNQRHDDDGGAPPKDYLLSKSISSRINEPYPCHQSTMTHPAGHQYRLPMSDRAFEMPNPRRKRTDVVPTISCKPPLIAHRLNSTLNNRKKEFSSSRDVFDSTKLKPPFHTYGWANNVNEMGRQQTHNILVHSNEVHPSALMAKKIRSELCQPNLLNFARKSKSISNLTSINNCANDPQVNQWTTEYMRNYYRRASGEK